MNINRFMKGMYVRAQSCMHFKRMFLSWSVRVAMTCLELTIFPFIVYVFHTKIDTNTFHSTGCCIAYLYLNLCQKNVLLAKTVLYL